jgi:hypothetical protein
VKNQVPFPNPDTQFKPGVSGNPGGRPKGRSIVARIRELLDRTTDLQGMPLEGGRTLGDLLAEQVLRNALEGDVKAAKDLLDRLEGRSRQSVPEQGDTTVRDAALARLRAIHDRPGSDSP